MKKYSERKSTPAKDFLWPSRAIIEDYVDVEKSTPKPSNSIESKKTPHLQEFHYGYGKDYVIDDETVREVLELVIHLPH